VTLTEYIDALKNRWIAILVSAVVIMAIAASASLVLDRSKTYTSATQLFVTASVAKGNPDLMSQRNAIAQSRTASYVNVIEGSVVEDQVAAKIGEKSLSDDKIVVSVEPGTVVLKVAVTSASAKRAAEIATAYGEVVPAEVERLERIGAEDPQVAVSVIDEAAVAKSSDPVPYPLAWSLAAGLIFGLGLGFSIVIVREVLRRERAEAGAETAGEA
jgi:capsular polysaccharide biosynthesis protein